MALFQEIKEGLFSYEEPTSGWVIRVKNARALLDAAKKVKEAGIKKFDCFSPFPIHGLDEAMGLRRSWITLVTLIAGLTGASAAISMMVYIMVIDWPQIFGGKPNFSWPAFIPITFELTVLFAGFSTVGAVIALGKLGKISRKPVMGGVNSDALAIWIGDDTDKSRVEAILGDLAEDIQPVNSGEA